VQRLGEYHLLLVAAAQGAHGELAVARTDAVVRDLACLSQCREQDDRAAAGVTGQVIEELGAFRHGAGEGLQ
jgi:hypothetical protein